MPKSRGVRIVKQPGNRSWRDVDVYDLETGAKLLNVYRIQIDISPDGHPAAMITLTTGDDWEYEGPAEFQTVDQPAQD